ncbi:MAG: hypothetical protein HOW73_13225 [Polyangiaceae bacterium]|nr:hypothetical protein [Polyangiaceae bacterium]
MSADAIAILKLPYHDLCAALDIEPVASAKDAIETASSLVPLGTTGVACLLDIPFSSDDEALTEEAVTILGEALASHDDPRGIFIAEESSLTGAALDSYDAAVATIGGAGKWIPTPAVLAEENAPPLGELFGGAFAGTIANIQSQLAADPRMARALEGGGAGPDLSNPDLLQMAQQMLSQMSPEQQAQLEQMARSMFGGLDPNVLAGMSGGAPIDAEAEEEDEDDDDDDDDPEFGGADDAPAKPPAKK